MYVDVLYGVCQRKLPSVSSSCRTQHRAVCTAAAAAAAPTCMMRSLQISLKSVAKRALLL
jgi:hypothetical protein